MDQLTDILNDSAKVYKLYESTLHPWMKESLSKKQFPKAAFEKLYLESPAKLSFISKNSLDASLNVSKPSKKELFRSLKTASHLSSASKSCFVIREANKSVSFKCDRVLFPKNPQDRADNKETADHLLQSPFKCDFSPVSPDSTVDHLLPISRINYHKQGAKAERIKDKEKMVTFDVKKPGDKMESVFQYLKDMELGRDCITEGLAKKSPQHQVMLKKPENCILKNSHTIMPIQQLASTPNESLPVKAQTVSLHRIVPIQIGDREDLQILSETVAGKDCEDISVQVEDSKLTDAFELVECSTLERATTELKDNESTENQLPKNRGKKAEKPKEQSKGNKSKSKVRVSLQPSSLNSQKLHRLYEWCLKPVIASECVCIEGYRRGGCDAGVWSSTTIVNRRRARTLESSSGTIYVIEGKILEEEMVSYGFPSYVTSAFKKGFPVNWESIIKRYFKEIRHSKLVKDPKLSGSWKTQPTDEKKHSANKRSPENLCTIIKIDSLPVTRSGRKIVPPLAWWKREMMDNSLSMDYLNDTGKNLGTVSYKTSQKDLETAVSVSSKKRSNAEMELTKENLQERGIVGSTKDAGRKSKCLTKESDRLKQQSSKNSNVAAARTNLDEKSDKDNSGDAGSNSLAEESDKEYSGDAGSITLNEDSDKDDSGDAGSNSLAEENDKEYSCDAGSITLNEDSDKDNSGDAGSNSLAEESDKEYSCDAGSITLNEDSDKDDSGDAGSITLNEDSDKDDSGDAGSITLNEDSEDFDTVVENPYKENAIQSFQSVKKLNSSNNILTGGNRKKERFSDHKKMKDRTAKKCSNREQIYEPRMGNNVVNRIQRKGSVVKIREDESDENGEDIVTKRSDIVTKRSDIITERESCADLGLKKKTQMVRESRGKNLGSKEEKEVWTEAMQCSENSSEEEVGNCQKSRMEKTKNKLENYEKLRRNLKGQRLGKIADEKGRVTECVGINQREIGKTTAESEIRNNIKLQEFTKCQAQLGRKPLQQVKEGTHTAEKGKSQHVLAVETERSKDVDEELKLPRLRCIRNYRERMKQTAMKVDSDTGSCMVLRNQKARIGKNLNEFRPENLKTKERLQTIAGSLASKKNGMNSEEEEKTRVMPWLLRSQVSTRQTMGKVVISVSEIGRKAAGVRQETRECYDSSQTEIPNNNRTYKTRQADATAHKKMTNKCNSNSESTQQMCSLQINETKRKRRTDLTAESMQRKNVVSRNLKRKELVEISSSERDSQQELFLGKAGQPKRTVNRYNAQAAGCKDTVESNAKYSDRESLSSATNFEGKGLDGYNQSVGIADGPLSDGGKLEKLKCSLGHISRQENSKWLPEEKKKLNSALINVPKDAPRFWEKVAEIVVTRSAEECHQHFYFEAENIDFKKKKKTKTQKNSDGNFNITASRGTLKRKQQFCALLDKQNEGYEDDVFESTPFMKKKRPRLNFGINDVDECFGPLADFHTPSVSGLNCVTPSSSFYPVPVSDTKTPASSLTMSMELDRSMANKYMKQFGDEKKKKKKTKINYQENRAANSKARTKKPMVRSLLCKLLGEKSNKTDYTSDSIDEDDDDL